MIESDWCESGRIRIVILFTLSVLLPVCMAVVSTLAAPQRELILTPVGTRQIAEGELLALDLTVTGGNNRTPAFRAEGLPPGAEFDAGQGRFNWTPDFHQAGTFIVTFTVTDGISEASETVFFNVKNTNRSPQISGQPDPVTRVGDIYFFAPTATDPDGGNLLFSIDRLPSWASFDRRVGVLSGIPGPGDVGTSPQMTISVTDGIESVSLPPFVIAVVVPQEAVDEGVNFGDLDTDSDDVSNRRDGFPFDPTRADWVIEARSGNGGDIHPTGDTSVLFGGSQRFNATPKAGYYLSDLLVNGVSVGLVDSYEFVHISSHHSIHAEFSSIPSGLSQNPLDPGLSGVARLDGGDDSHNRVEGRPRKNLDYRFHVVLRDKGVPDNHQVFVVINGYRYPMSLDRGVLAKGAQYAFVTRLGPASTHRFYFIVESREGKTLWRYPATGDLPGPVIELLAGRNLVGIAAHVNPFALTPQEMFGESPLYRWQSQTSDDGVFEPVDVATPIAAGEGYLLIHSSGTTLPDFSSYGEIKAAVHEFLVTPGWNLIANPYTGIVPLAQVLVRVGENKPSPWLTAVSQQQVVDGVYTYLGDSWGAGYEFFSAAGTNTALLIPWVGYWIYVQPTDEPISLVIPKPER